MAMKQLFILCRAGQYVGKASIVAKRWASWFDELGQGHNDLVGKKCANLGEMCKMGLRVPPGFLSLRTSSYYRPVQRL